MTNTSFDWSGIVNELYRLVRLKTTPVGMTLFDRADALDTLPKVRRPKARHTLDQIVGQAARLGWAVGVTADDLALQQCGAVVGLHPQDERFREGAFLTGVWYATPADSAAHQQALHTVPHGRAEALVVAPLASGLLDPPDVCLIYATPGQMILLINGLQYRGYRRFDWSVVGETACADSWGRALVTGEPSLSIPCYAERRFGGVADDELLLALPPRYLQPLIDGLTQLAANGVRYPIPPFGVQADARAGLPASYPVLGR